MHRLRTFAALVLAVFWLPITMHCQLESLPGFDFLAHCLHAEDASHHDNDCNEDGCAVVESGLYTSATQRLEITVPPLSSCALFSPIVDFDERLSRSELPIIGQAPADTPLPWQFALRAALPPRAPSPLA